MNIRRHLSGPTIAAILLAAAHTAPAHADSVTAEIANTLPAYEVIGNGSSYTQLTGPATGLVFDVVADAGVAGQVTSVSYDANASVSGGPGGGYSLPSQSDSRTFSGLFHKTESLVGGYDIAAAELVAACNDLADALRAQGLGDAQIFGQDRLLTLTVSVDPDASFSGPSGFVDAPQIVYSETSLTCREWAGTSGFAPPPALSATDGVSDSSLTLIEHYGPSGMCKVVLSGVVTTTAPDMDVEFRYEHFDGKKSDVKTVTTDASKTAFFSHDYAIPNGDGPEGGSIRIVGVSPSFTSNTAAYSMDCGEPGATGVQASLLPELSLVGEPSGQVQVGGQVCPTTLRLIGTITGRGGSISGQAFFVGPDIASTHEPYQVGGTQAVVIEQSLALEWTAQPAQALTLGNGPAPLKTQSVVAGFNVLGSDNTEIGNVPQRPITVACAPPTTPAVSGGGFAPLPGSPPAPTALPAGSGNRAVDGTRPAMPAQRTMPPQPDAPPGAPAGARRIVTGPAAPRVPPAAPAPAPAPEDAAREAAAPGSTDAQLSTPIRVRKEVDAAQPLATSPRGATAPATERAPRQARPDDGTARDRAAR